MNFKQLKDFDFKNIYLKNIEIDRNQFERIAVGVIILCALSLFLVTIKTQHSIKVDGTKITYKGQMQNHRLNGQGTLTYDNGDTYTGEFKNGSFNGQGTFKSHEGWTYVGEFKSGQADGQGKLTTENKVTYKGKFKQGIFKG